MSETATAVVLGTVTFVGLTSWGYLAGVLGRLARREWQPPAPEPAPLKLVPPPEFPPPDSAGLARAQQALAVAEREYALRAAQRIRQSVQLGPPRAEPRGNGVLLSELLGEEGEGR